MFKVNIRDTSYSIQLNKNEVILDDELWSGDLLKVGENLFHLIKDSKSYLIEILSVDHKLIQLKVNGIKYEAHVQDKYDLLLEKLGMNQTNDTNHSEIRAPMPGLILDVLVEKGQTVSKGDKLLILEAMKMENIIKSTSEGTIEAIAVEKGMNVEKNQVLIQF